MKTIRNDSWVRCPECRHKLFKMAEGGEASPSSEEKKVSIEIKCQSCKKISVLQLKNGIFQ